MTINEKPYNELVTNIYMCGALDVNRLIEDEGVEVVVDLRAELDPNTTIFPNVTRIHVPLKDDSQDVEEVQMNRAIQEVISSYNEGKKVAFHCGAGRGRTGAVAIGVLMELNLVSSIEEAEEKSKKARSILSINDAQRATLERLYK